jgi:hemin uptake protein HemP
MQGKLRHPGTAVNPLSPTSGAEGLVASHDPNIRRRFISEQLLGGSTEVEIQHGESIYRLRLTSLGKLILTK